MRLILALSLFAYTAFANEECPAFGQWKDWTDKCLWFPITEMRKDIATACDITFNKTTTGFTGLMPSNFVMPDKCGQCSFKFRCRKRDRKEGCLSVEGEKTTCTEFGDVCDLPPTPLVGCRWGMFAEAFKACTFRPDIPDWRRKAYREFLEMMPEGNCLEKNGRCKCCCHPYHPNDEGTACVKAEETTQCPAFGEYNEWSQCQWFPLANIANGFRDHCGLDFKGDIPNVVPTPAGFQIPEKCGMCSFRVRCRKRDRKEGCFHIEVDKKACGKEDCTGCADVCTVPQLTGNNCNWTQFMGQAIVKKVEAMTSGIKLPYWRKRGLKDLFKNLPYGKCKDINGQCKCCCHPYEPNEDGTKCVLSDVCHFE